MLSNNRNLTDSGLTVLGGERTLGRVTTATFSLTGASHSAHFVTCYLVELLLGSGLIF